MKQPLIFLPKNEIEKISFVSMRSTFTVDVTMKSLDVPVSFSMIDIAEHTAVSTWIEWSNIGKKVLLPWQPILKKIKKI